MQNLLHNLQAEVTGDDVIVRTLTVSSTDGNREGFSLNCEYGISHRCAPARRNIYVISRPPMTEMGRIIDETSAIIGNIWNQYGALGKYINGIENAIYLLNIAMVCVTYY